MQGIVVDDLWQKNEFYEVVFQDLRRFIAHKLGIDAGSEQYVIRGSVASGTALRRPRSDLDVDLVFSKNYLLPKGNSWGEFTAAVNQFYGICVGVGFSNISCHANQDVTRSFQLLHINETEIEIFIKYREPGSVDNVWCFGTDHNMGNNSRRARREESVQFHSSVPIFQDLTNLQRNTILIKHFLKHHQNINEIVSYLWSFEREFRFGWIASESS